MKLLKNLSFTDVFCIATGAMISSGIFLLPGIAFAKIGPAVFIAYFLAGMFALLGSLSMVELTTAMPKAGGSYFFVERSMGPFIGSITGFLSWFSIILKTAFAIFGLSVLINQFSGLPMFPVGAICTVIFIILNIIGIKDAAKLQNAMVFFMLILMIAFAILGYFQMNTAAFKPFIKGSSGFNAIFATAAFVFVSFGGLLDVTSVAEEVKNPKRNIPASLISSILVVSFVYALVLIAVVGILPANEFSKSLTPLADAAKRIIGMPGFIAITVAAALAFLTTGNAGIMSASRYPLALSRDEHIPQVMSKVNKRFNTPIISIVITGILIILSLMLNLETLVEVASTVILTKYILVNFAVLIFRSSKVQNYKPSFKAPLYPLTQIVSIILFITLIIYMGAKSIEISIGALIVCIIFYFIYAGKNRKEYAFLHLIENITSKKLTSDNLEEELKEILHERDEVVKDDFDKLIEDALILDLEGPLNLEDFFQQIAPILSSDTGLNESSIIKLLHERESDASTAISPFTAIPHIVSEKKCFKIAIARCKNGIKFSDTANIKAVILIVGSKEHRGLHLRTISAIAHITQHTSFEDDWINAKKENNLRDIFLLGTRKRFQP
jgi:basic amino acid/polyamine antiporter, APA family